MELFLSGHTYQYAVEQIMLMLFPGERPVYPAAPSGALRAYVALHEGAVWLTATTRITDTDGEEGVTYTYHVYAVDNQTGLTSDWSGEATVRL